MPSMQQYDEETLKFIQQAKNRIAVNHGLEMTEDPVEVMNRRNKEIREAAMNVKRSKGMVKQNIRPIKKKAAPVVERSNSIEADEIPMEIQSNTVQRVQNVPEYNGVQDMAAEDYDAVMAKLMRSGMIQPDFGEDNENELEDQYLDQEPEPEPVAPAKPVKQVKPAIESEVNTERRRTETKRQTAPVVEPPKPVKQQVVAPAKTPKEHRMYDQFTEIRGLPSHGVFYEGAMYGQSFKLIDVMTLGDIDADNVNDIFDEIFGRRIQGVDPAEILADDEVYLLHWLRASSFTDQPLPVYQYKCPTSGEMITDPQVLEKIKITFNDLSFETNKHPDDIMEKHMQGYYAFTLPDGRECDIYLRRRSHEVEVAKYLRYYREKYHKDASVALELIVRNAVVIEIEGCENIHDKISYLSELDVSDAKLIFDTMADVSLTTTIKATFVCPHCGKEVTVDYPFRLDDYISSL